MHCDLGPEIEVKPCSVTCGGGYRVVYKEARVMHKNGGKECPPHELKQHPVFCNTQPCPAKCANLLNGNGECDASNNNALCNFDGGDCRGE